MRSFLISSVLTAAAAFLISGGAAPRPAAAVELPSATPACTHYFICNDNPRPVYMTKSACLSACKGGVCTPDSTC
jgi:hypothetical protein